MLVSAKQLKKETNLEAQVPGIETAIKEIAVETEKAAGGGMPVLTPEQNREARREMISTLRFEPEDFAYERSIGNNDSVYSNFAELIALSKRKVGKIEIKENGKLTGYATGFMVSPRLMLTNWHVFKAIGEARQSELHFFYELDVQGHKNNAVIFLLRPDEFFYNNEERDYCFVAVNPVDISNKVRLQEIGYLFLDITLGKLGDKGKEKMNIIHHPQGDYKQLSIRENTFKELDGFKLFYETDTAPGSSGSPVFNDQWQVVGLHHKSVAKMTPDKQQYLDKDGNIIPIVNDKIDVTKIVWEKNEGIRISTILKHVTQQHPDNTWVQALWQPPPQQLIAFGLADNITTGLETQKNNTMPDTSNKNIHISVPVEALSNERSIDISLSIKNLLSAPAGRPGSSSTIKENSGIEEMLEEKAKLEREDEMVYSECEGYDDNFLGTKIPLPQPMKSLERQVALTKNGKKNELKYFKYSVIFNAVRKMPIISAINVEGNPKLRLDDSKRKDNWLRDNRIDYECQLTDAFYAGSRFDKGHMGRFEDANWDTTEKKALRNGIYTCIYTNACPQVPDINRTGDNLWGNLEKAILEKGVKKEKGPQARISVFNGPIFDEDKDRQHLGVFVPMQFYKIIMWLDDAGNLKATGFKLSQEENVTDDQFDEALNIDKLVAYKEYRCSIKKLGQLTKIDFKHIEKFDTFKSNDGGDETLLAGEESVVL